EPSADLKDGANTLTLVAEETFATNKREGTPSGPFTLITGEDGIVLQHSVTATVNESASSDRDLGTQAYSGVIYAERDTSLPTLSGGAPGEIGKQGSIAQIVVGGEYYEVDIDPATGRYSWTATVPFSDGDYSVSVTVKDRAGNIGKPTLYTLRVDTTPPEAPELINLYDDQGANQSSFDPGETTDDKRPQLTGLAQAGTTVYLKDASGKTIGSALADKVTGIWKMEPNEDLKDGANNLTLVAEETFAGKTRTGTSSAAFTIVIGADTPVLPPNTITIKEAIDDVGAYTGKLASGALTDDTTPTLRGDVSAGNSVTIYYRLAGSSTWAGSATAAVSGTEWSWTPGSALPYGAYEFQASIGSFSSSLFTLDIATAADIINKTRIETVKDDFGAWQGELSSGAITDDATPSFSGRGEANGKVVLRYTQAGQLANTVVVDVDSSGRWTWTPASGLPAGNWSFEVQPQGHNAWSDSFSLSITGSDGFNPVITDGYDDMGTSMVLANGDTTDDTTPTLNGRAEANSIVYLRAASGTNDNIYSLTTNPDGNWSWTPQSALALGNWEFQVSKSAASGWSDTFKLNLEVLPQGSSGEERFDWILEYLRPNGGGPDRGLVPANTIMNDGLRLLKAAEVQLISGVHFIHINPSSIYPGSPTGLSLGWDNGTTDVTFDIVSSPSRIYIARIKIYDTKGLLLSDQNEGIDVGPHTLNKYRYFAPEGRLIGKVDISTTKPDATGGIDNILWGTKLPRALGINEEQKSENLINSDDNAHKLHETGDLAHKYIIGSESKTDTLQLTHNDQLLDLTADIKQIESIEIIDITGSGDNILKLDLNALLQHGEKDLFIEDGKTQLLVKGNEGDVVQLKDILPEGSDISEWQHQDGTITIAGVEYNVYSHGDEAELLVQQGVKTELI
ncbi:Ig-like domain-containing protein, partial [Pantoea sp. CTOTU49201]|uniref:Ig-like domain-containing protein n=1 Tax=Pantoea sp. CTOTU49201 TaxID=2953855 RepID=UPI00289E4966